MVHGGRAECPVIFADLEPDADLEPGCGSTGGARAREGAPDRGAAGKAWREDATSVVDRLVAAGEFLAEQLHVGEGLAAARRAAARSMEALVAADEDDLRDSCIEAYVACAELEGLEHDDGPTTTC